MIKHNQDITIDYNIGWSTHMPVLIRLFSLTDGPIMEVGSGVYSTPLLHWLCYPTGRLLITYESDKNFIKLAEQYRSDNHIIQHVEDYLQINVSEHYSIIFIDHWGHHRGKTAVHLKNCADYIVLHDTNVIRRNSYQLLPGAFKYYRDYTLNRPWTGVASNFKPVDALW